MKRKTGKGKKVFLFLFILILIFGLFDICRTEINAKKIPHSFASVNNAREILLSNTEYYEKYSQNDIDFRMKKSGATKDEFMKVLEVNLVGPFLLIQGLFSILDNGIVINISSTDGIDTYSSINIDYSASKAGLINLTKSLSITLNNIKIYAICPNWMNTETIMNMNQEYLKEEMNRIGQNELIDPNIIASKIIELTNSNLESGTIIVVGDNNE